MTNKYNPTLKSHRHSRQQSCLSSWPLSAVHYTLHFCVCWGLSWPMCNQKVASSGVIVAKFFFYSWQWYVAQHHTECIVTFPQQWLREHVTVLRYTYIACLFYIGILPTKSLYFI